MVTTLVIVLVVSWIFYLLKFAAVPALLIGVVGIVVSGFFSNKYYNKTNQLERIIGIEKGKPFAGTVPTWVSLINLISFGCLIYGVIKIIFL